MIPSGTPPTPLEASVIAHLQSWEGRSETLNDTVTAFPVAALSAVLDRDDPPPQAGSALPPLWHWLFMLPRHRQSELGPDGHAQRGGFLPPVPFPRRMWAGGRLHWNADNPLRVGDAVRRESRIASVRHKTGRTGELVFVVVRHELSNAKGMSLTEEHDIVYRPAAQPGESARAEAARSASPLWQREVRPDDVLLFRYSALTFNGHRIHYDRRYVTEVEGYPGLVVHGPLIATLLVDLLRRQLPQAHLQSFEFRAVRPTFDLHPFFVSGNPASDGKRVELWASDHQALTTMQATATLA